MILISSSAGKPFYCISSWNPCDLKEFGLSSLHRPAVIEKQEGNLERISSMADLGEMSLSGERWQG